MISPLCSGAHQFGRRWNTVSSPTFLAIVPDDLHAGRAGADHRDPLAGEVDGSSGQLWVWKDWPSKLSMPSMRGIVGADSRPMAVIRKRGVCRLPSSR